MLRINLLPSYVGQRRLTRKLSVVFAVLFLLCLAGPLAAYIVMKGTLATVSANADQAEADKKTNDAIKSQAASTLAQVAPIKTKLDFVNQVNAYTRQQVAIFNTLADTSPRASLIYTDATISGTTMTIKAFAPNIAEVGRYLQWMYHAEPDFTSVSIDKIPGYPDALTHKYYLDGRLVFADSAGSGGAGSGGPGGSPMSSPPPNSSSGPGGTSGSTSPSAPPAGFTPEDLSPTGPKNIPSDVTPPPVELTGGGPAPSSGGPGGSMPGGSGPGAGASSGGYSPAFLDIVNHKISPFATDAVRQQLINQELKRVVMKTEPRGFDITVTATLKQALTAPAVPGGPGGSSGPGGPGGPGMPGMPGSSSG